ncbi:hypothetical protein ACFLY7_00195 [Patescibacteria group bacterium]
MSKRNIIILILSLTILALAGAFTSYLLTTGEKTPQDFEELRDFFPFGEEPETTTRELERGEVIEEVTETPEIITDTDFPILRQISRDPISGAVTELQEDGSYLIRFIQKSNGHIYETETNRLTQKRISNTTIPKIYDADWLNINSLIIRYLDDNDQETIKTFVAQIKKNDLEETNLEGIFFPDNITQIAHNKEKIFYLTNTENNSLGILTNIEGDTPTQIFSSPFNEWLINWAGGDIITLTTKPSNGVDGYVYSLNSRTEKFDKILGEIDGLLTLLSPNSSKLIYSVNNKSGITSFLYDLQTNESIETPFGIIPEKCTWGKESIYIYCGIPANKLTGDYPDEWYQGLESTTDEVWKIDVENDFFDFLASPRDLLNTEIDAINLILSENEDYLFFTNKKDLTLWSLKLK